MLTLRRGRVAAVVSRAEGLARIEVDGVPCVAYPHLTGPVGARPVSLSDTLRTLRERGLLAVTVAAEACIDGDVHCVSAPSVLLWCRTEGFDVVVCGIGPGIVGTGSSFGHGGLAAAVAA